MNNEIPKFYQISKTLRRSLENPNVNKIYKNKYLSKIDEDIKEENKEEDFLYSDKEEDDFKKVTNEAMNALEVEDGVHLFKVFQTSLPTKKGDNLYLDVKVVFISEKGGVHFVCPFYITNY